ncbi:MAG: ornithine carbamoyltransferase [Chloroflexi bacterium]|nr:ornithine carbamoyltransferase [Chloroflexota bacterium]
MHVVPGSPTPHSRHLLSISDLDPGEIGEVLDSALTLKVGSPAWIGRGGPLARKHVALLFDKPSLRTRVSFEVGIGRLGGTVTNLSASEIGLGSRESYADIARTLSRYVDAIVIRMHSHPGLAELAGAAEVPVINALTELEHPCQALADLLTLREHLGSLKGRQLVFVGDGNNVCHSLLLGGAAVGLHVRVASPAGYEPAPAIVEEATRLARRSGARIEVVHDPVVAVAGADAVYTDVWASMGSEHEAAARRRVFAPFQVNSELLAVAPAALVMHCLPAHRGEEITAEVIDGPTSVAFDQAENRTYAQQAVLLHLLRARSVSRASMGVAEPAPLRPALAGVAALRP